MPDMQLILDNDTVQCLGEASFMGMLCGTCIHMFMELFDPHGPSECALLQFMFSHFIDAVEHKLILHRHIS